MGSKSMFFDEQAVLSHLSHYLPAQGALKDFVHHNTLHAFQHQHFKDALFNASKILGYSTYLSIDEFRDYYQKGKIKTSVLHQILKEHIQAQGEAEKTSVFEYWKTQMLETDFSQTISSRIGYIRQFWQKQYHIHMDKAVHPILLRLLSAFLDQGIAHWTFPYKDLNFLEAVLALSTQGGFAKIFHSKRVENILLKREYGIENLLKILIGNSTLYEDYLFDQQFAHAGWSGFVHAVAEKPSLLFASRKITLKEVIQLELLLEIEALDKKYGENWSPLSNFIPENHIPYFAPIEEEELKTVQYLWQKAFEYSYFHEVFAGIKKTNKNHTPFPKKTFQALCCIDDRCYSFRRNVENVDEYCETFGTPGFFGIEFFFKPEKSKFHTKACPNPIMPNYIIPETGRKDFYKKDMHLNKSSNDLVKGWFWSNTLGFSSAFELIKNLFRPQATPLMVASYKHMDKNAKLQIEATGELLHGLKVGFTVSEMAERLAYVFKSIGLVKDFAAIVYIIGHGASSVNNTYYAGYDCGACCGRPGSINARVFAYMANKAAVRAALAKMEIYIPETTIFVGAMHDTTKDEIYFYDEEEIIKASYKTQHKAHIATFQKALLLNAKERAYRFENIDKNAALEKIHKAVKKRAYSFFETRPEWNHTAAALTIIGKRNLFKHLYLDKRAFANSYDYTLDKDGQLLLKILKASIPVSGGIALEYYFSRVDQQKLGAGSKLPHNVVGLFAVTNGIEGDLRPGLPSQMIEIHDPLRMMFIVEQNPEIVLAIIRNDKAIFEWIDNEWVLFTVFDSNSQTWYQYKNNAFVAFEPLDLNIAESHKPEADYFANSNRNLLLIL